MAFLTTAVNVPSIGAVVGGAGSDGITQDVAQPKLDLYIASGVLAGPSYCPILAFGPCLPTIRGKDRYDAIVIDCEAVITPVVAAWV